MHLWARAVTLSGTGRLPFWAALGTPAALLMVLLKLSLGPCLCASGLRSGTGEACTWVVGTSSVHCRTAVGNR